LEPILEEERRFARLAERTREVQFGEFTTSRRADPSAEIEPSPGLREVLCLSEKEARRLGHKFIKPEHYLLAILGINECVAVQVLRGLGVDPHQLREDLETDLHPRRETEGFVSSPAPSVAAEQLIQAAKDIANQLRHGWYGTAHLLLALIREEGLLPGKVLRRFGVSYAAAHEETRGMLTPFRGQWVLDPKPE
jgi:ATP-dependent Clp protease ATP-binding subunit ClpA